jgi:hypothetical protein
MPGEVEALKPDSSKKRWRRLGLVFLPLLLLLVLSAVGLKMFINSRVHKLQHLMAEIQSLRPGVSSFEDAMRIARKYGAEKPSARFPCSVEKCILRINVTWCDPNTVPTNHLDNSLLNSIGIHFWDAWGWIELEKSVVIGDGAGLSVEGPPFHLWHEAGWSLETEIPKVDEHEQKQFLHNFNPEHDETPAFLVDWAGSGHVDLAEILYVRMSVHANGEQRRAAQEFNVNCLTKWGDCSSVRQLLPGAAQYYTSRYGIQH